PENRRHGPVRDLERRNREIDDRRDRDRPAEQEPVDRPRVSEQGVDAHAAGIAATPGSSLPSSSSSEAPPPVDTQETRSARPSSLTARSESPPPTTEYASAS